MVLGGYEIACANVAKAMSQLGHEVRVLTTWSHLPLSAEMPTWVCRSLDLHWHIPHKSSNVTIDQRDLHSAVCSSYSNTINVLNTLKSFRPDVVYVWNLVGIGGAAILDLLNIVRVPWVIHLMDRVPVEIASNTPENVLGLFNANGSDLYDQASIISMSEHLLDEIGAVSGIYFPQGATIIPGAVDLSKSIPHKPYLRDGRARFVTAGAVLAHKGIDLILEASAILRSEGFDFLVDIYGDGDLPQYLDMSKGLRVDKNVRFLGSRSQDDLFALYADYDAFLFPTWEREPFGFAPIEAAGCGALPIITRNCGASERLVDGVHCLKIDRNVRSLADAMRRIANGSVNVERIGLAGKRLVSSDLSFTKCVDRIEKTLAEHANAWSFDRLDDPWLPLLCFLKHNLSISLRFD